MLTAPITTPHFRDRIFNLFETMESDFSSTISPLTKEDSDLAPGEFTSQLLATASPWIDLSSPDPLVYSVSRQVLHLEIAFASFCGAANIIIPGPRLHHGNIHKDGVAQYAYTIQEILEIGMYHQVHIRLAMSDEPAADREEQRETLSVYARPDFEGAGQERQRIRSDVFGTWDAWNVVRSICKYNARLFVGKMSSHVITFVYSRCHIMLVISSLFVFVPHVQPVPQTCPSSKTTVSCSMWTLTVCEHSGIFWLTRYLSARCTQILAAAKHNISMAFGALQTPRFW